MKNQLPDHNHILGISISAEAYPVERAPRGLLSKPPSQCHFSTPNGSPKLKQNKVDKMIKSMNKLGKKADDFAHGILEHVRLGPTITATVKGKLSLGLKIVHLGGLEKVFKQNFSVRQGEKMVKASQCYLSTTAGPIAGLLFISTDNLAFTSERSIKVSSPTGDLIRFHYKVLIPLKNIKRVNESKNVKNQFQNYIEIVTVDNFDFWFMGFLNAQKSFKYLHKAISQAQCVTTTHSKAIQGELFISPASSHAFT